MAIAASATTLAIEATAFMDYLRTAITMVVLASVGYRSCCFDCCSSIGRHPYCYTIGSSTAVAFHRPSSYLAVGNYPSCGTAGSSY